MNTTLESLEINKDLKFEIDRLKYVKKRMKSRTNKKGRSGNIVVPFTVSDFRQEETETIDQQVHVVLLKCSRT